MYFAPSFDKLRTSVNRLNPLVVSLSNHAVIYEVYPQNLYKRVPRSILVRYDKKVKTYLE